MRSKTWHMWVCPNRKIRARRGDALRTNRNERPSATGGRRWEKLKALALDSVTSPHSRRAYASALDNFSAWYRAASGAPLSKAVVNSYKAHLEAEGLSASTINARLSALRKLVAEAADNGLIPLELAEKTVAVERLWGLACNSVPLVRVPRYETPHAEPRYRLPILRAPTLGIQAIWPR